MNNSFLFITANNNEKEAFKKIFQSDKEDYIDGHLYNTGVFGNHYIVYIHIKIQGYTNPASMPLVGKLMTKIKPIAVIMVGIAFGINENKQKIGDVLVSDKILPYDSKKVQINDIIYKESPKEAGYYLVNAFRNNDEWEYDLGEGNKSTVHIGALLTGSELINNFQRKEDLVNHFKEYSPIGGDMEAFGVYSQCRQNSIDEWIIIKGISDWGYNKNNNKENYQKIAANAAVEYCHFIFNKKNIFNDLLINNNINNHESYNQEKYIIINNKKYYTNQLFIFGCWKNRPLEWIILDIIDDKMLIITKDCLINFPYHDIHENITWSQCTLRKQLIPNLLNQIFTDNEKEKILYSEISNINNRVYSTPSGFNTIDTMFLLDIDEAKTYFQYDEIRISHINNNTAAWWLRTPGKDNTYASMVVGGGGVNIIGYNVNMQDGSVRPALWYKK